MSPSGRPDEASGPGCAVLSSEPSHFTSARCNSYSHQGRGLGCRWFDFLHYCREAWRAAVHGSHRVGHDFGTEQQHTTAGFYNASLSHGHAGTGLPSEPLEKRKARMMVYYSPHSAQLEAVDAVRCTHSINILTGTLPQTAVQPQIRAQTRHTASGRLHF